MTKVVQWFGYKLHLIVDAKHEVALAYQVTDTKAGDGETLPDLVAKAQANLPERRIETLAYDKAADTNEVHRALDKAGITVNKNTVPGETRSPFVTSGLRIGTSALTTRGMGEAEMHRIGEWIARGLAARGHEVGVTATSDLRAASRIEAAASS